MEVHPLVTNYFEKFIQTVEKYETVKASDIDPEAKKEKLMDLTYRMTEPARIMVTTTIPPLQKVFATLYVHKMAAESVQSDEKREAFFDVCKEIAKCEKARKAFNIKE